MDSPHGTTSLNALLLAALSLPAMQPARAEPPEEGVIALRYLSYQDSQPGADRVHVDAPSLSILAPLAGNWSLGANHVVDTISGASPAYHTEALSKLQDRRRATDLSATRYGEDGSVTVGASFSSEADYVSRGVSMAVSYSSADRNRTWNGALNLLHDSINPTNHRVQDEHKSVAELALGVTEVLSQNDLAQLTLGYSHGRGYFSDPYKVFDQRPRERDHGTLLTRWNHHFEASGGSSRLAYRYYVDSFQIRAHTFTAEYVQPLSGGWSVTPLLRLYSQSAASFYVDLDPAAAPFPTNPPRGAQYSSEEQRMAGYGARSVGLAVAKELADKWQVDISVERYAQRAGYKLFGSGNPYLAPFSAHIAQVGISRRF
ncbi:MAG: DUF3570 domain-containing protein [Pseudomonadota bacterium]